MGAGAKGGGGETMTEEENVEIKNAVKMRIIQILDEYLAEKGIKIPE
jgi:hypothetical protein